MKILMTGGTGFIGSHFRKFARGKGVFVHDLNRRIWDFRKPWKGPAPFGYDYFIHFGANVQARQSLDRPKDFVRDNILGTFHVLELARKVRPTMFVYISSAEVFGGCWDHALPHLEDSSYAPTNPYAATKAAGEILALTYWSAYKMPVAVVRTMCVWGLDQKDPSKFVPMVLSALKKREPVKIHVRDGQPGIRQWIHVDQFIQELWDLLPTMKANSVHHIFGEELNNLEIAGRVADLTQLPFLWEAIPMPETHDFCILLGRESS